MKRILLLFAIFALFNMSSPAQDLMLTGVIDGTLPGGRPKAIELYVINDISDLSVYGIASANNGNPSDGIEYGFPAESATAGDFIYLAIGTEDFETWFGFAATYADTSESAINVNGDDAIELYENGVLIDIIGVSGDRPGADETWNYLDGWVYRSGSGPSTTFDISDWILSGTDALDDILTNEAAGDQAFPFGTYVYIPGVGTSAGLNFNSALIASKIYPNPSKTGAFNLSFAKGHEELTLKVFNLVGDVVFTKTVQGNVTNTIIRISDLANGTYFLQVNDNYNNKESYRLLKW